MKKNNNKFLIVLLLLVALTSGYVASTYAKYTSEISGKNGSVTVAKWDFDVENGSNAFAKDVDLSKTYTAATLVDGKIAPGTEGAFSIQLTNANSEVGVHYEVTIGTVTGGTLPANLKFYKDAAHSQEIDGTNKVEGTLEPGDSTGTKATVYWAWAYETANGDEADTTAGRAASTLTIPVTITGTQVTPVEG